MKQALEEEAAAKEEAEKARLARAGKILRRRESIRDQYMQQLPPEPTEDDEEVSPCARVCVCLGRITCPPYRVPLSISAHSHSS